MGRARTILEEIATAEPEQPLASRVSGSDSIPEERADGTTVAFADHEPDAFDPSRTDAHAFWVSSVDDHLEVGLKTGFDALSAALDLLGQVLAMTEIRVGVPDAPDTRFDVQVTVPDTFDADELEVPDNWMKASYETTQGKHLKFSAFEGLVVEAVDDVEGDLRAVEETLGEFLAVVSREPASAAPTDPVAELYHSPGYDDLETEQALNQFVALLAHPRGVYAHLDDFTPKADHALHSLDTTVLTEDLDRSELADWIADDEMATYVLDEDDISALAGTDTALVQATLDLTVDGDRQEQTNVHLVATEDGDWKLVR